jgi:hypothetical protein
MDLELILENLILEPMMKLISLLLIPTLCFALDVSPNASYLSDLAYKANTVSIFSDPGLEQRYENRVRTYRVNQNYGLNTQADELNYENSMSGFHSETYHDLYRTAYHNELGPYVSNLKESNRNGSISQPVQYAGAVIGFFTGNTVKTNNMSGKIDLLNRYSEVKYSLFGTNGYINYNGTAQAGLSKSIMGLNYSFAVQPGTKVNTVSVPLFSGSSLAYDQVYSRPNDSVVRVGYGVNF